MAKEKEKERVISKEHLLAIIAIKGKDKGSTKDYHDKGKGIDLGDNATSP